MSISAAQFRANFPEFGSTIAYPDASVTMWLTYAYAFLNPCRWSVVIDLGAQLFAAHNIVIGGVAAAEGGNGAPPGMVSGPIASKSVGDLTITYDVGLGVNEDDQHWGMTNYGTRFIKLARQFGSGPVQIGRGRTPIGQSGGAVGYPMGQPWPGPMFNNFTNP